MTHHKGTQAYSKTEKSGTVRIENESDATIFLKQGATTCLPACQLEEHRSPWLRVPESPGSLNASSACDQLCAQGGQLGQKEHLSGQLLADKHHPGQQRAQQTGALAVCAHLQTAGIHVYEVLLAVVAGEGDGSSQCCCSSRWMGGCTHYPSAEGKWDFSSHEVYQAELHTWSCWTCVRVWGTLPKRHTCLQLTTTKHLSP